MLVMSTKENKESRGRRCEMLGVEGAENLDTLATVTV